MKNLNPWIVCFCAVFFSIQAIVYFYFENSRIRWELRLSEKAKNIADDQIEELMYINNNLKSEKESIATQSFVSGVVDSIKNKDNYNAIWHDGYNRGGMVAQYTKEIIEEETKKNP